jgi:hypothetical protein
MKKTRYFIRSHEEGFSIIDDWTGQTVSRHDTWPSATKAAFILEKQSRDQVEAERLYPLSGVKRTSRLAG